jgi:nitrate reductase beta subunit
MRVMAQMAMVMNLDKCIGCHTCSVTCKQAWTNRSGVEYVWFNNVETRPGQGYPRTYQDQDRWQGGWELNKRGRLTLRAGGRVKKLLSIFANPLMPSIGDYYEPWTYDYENLIDAPLQEHSPVARPKSLISGKNMKVSWSANWDDDLGGSLGAHGGCRRHVVISPLPVAGAYIPASGTASVQVKGPKARLPRHSAPRSPHQAQLASADCWPGGCWMAHAS